MSATRSKKLRSKLSTARRVSNQTQASFLRSEDAHVEDGGHVLGDIRPHPQEALGYAVVA